MHCLTRRRIKRQRFHGAYFGKETDDNKSFIFGIRYVDLAGSMFDLGLAELAGFRFLHVLFID